MRNAKSKYAIRKVIGSATVLIGHVEHQDPLQPKFTPRQPSDYLKPIEGLHCSVEFHMMKAQFFQ